MGIKKYIETTKEQDKDGASPLVSLDEVVELIDQTDDEHCAHLRAGAPNDYINGWVEACEAIKRKLEVSQKP